MKAVFKAGVALMLAATMMTANTAPASAWHRHHGVGVAAGVAAGIIGLGILGAAAAEHDRYYADGYCHPGPLICHTFERPCFHNEYGDYICPAPERRCFRHHYCD